MVSQTIRGRDGADPIPASLRTETEQPARKGQMRFIDHLAVQTYRPGIRMFGKGLDDPARPAKFLFSDGEGLVDDGDLCRMDRHLGGETGTRGSTLGGEPRLVLEIGVDRVDRDSAGGPRAQQAERPSE